MEGLVLVFLFMFCVCGPIIIVFHTLMEYGFLPGLVLLGFLALIIFVIVKLVQFIF